MQRYLIDGHNLIPHIPGLSLRMIDDEQRLIALLQVYARVRRHAIEVYFDDAPPGQTGPRNFGTVRAVFTPLASTADAAIRDRLKALGKQARTVAVVTSDRQVQAEARAHGAALLSADEFARDLLAAQTAPPRPGKRGAPSAEEPRLPENEVEEWMRLFKEGKK